MRTATIALLVMTLSAFAQPTPIPNTNEELMSVIKCLGISSHEYKEWHNVLGHNIWLGYEQGGFAWPEDVKLMKWLRWGTSVGTRHIWIVFSMSTPDMYYILPFVSMEISTDSEGKHRGVHPCGAFAVERKVIDTLLDKHN